MFCLGMIRLGQIYVLCRSIARKEQTATRFFTTPIPAPFHYAYGGLLAQYTTQHGCERLAYKDMSEIVRMSTLYRCLAAKISEDL